MGFSWSSCVAQETLLSLCRIAGLDSCQALAADAEIPAKLDTCFAVATDDLMVFSDSGPGASLEPVRKVETAFLDHHVVQNPDKDIDDTADCTCVGVDLVSGSKWRAPGDRVWALLDAVLHLSSHRRASPGSVASYFGTAQWYDLLRRLRLSFFKSVYDFSSGAKARNWTVDAVPGAVLGELLLDIVLTLFGSVNMKLPFLPLLACTDASTEFGHGGVVAHTTVEDIRKISRLATKRGGYEA